MRKKRLMRLLAVCLFLLALVCICRRSEKKVFDREEEEESDAIQIGITFDSFINERWQRDRDVFVSAASELGAEVNVQNANGDMREQARQIDYFIEKKMDVIVVVLVASDEDMGLVQDAVARAHDAGIPVIAYDRMILGADVDLYISFDNDQVGRLMAEHMKSHLGNTGTLLQICGPLSDNNVSLVMDGFQDVLKGSRLVVKKTEYAPGWLPETGFDVTSEYLSTQAAPDGIMCGNDGLAGQAIKALSERRLAGKVCVVGQDADLDACQRVVEGTQCMTVYKPVEKLARRAAELAVNLAQGKEMETGETMDDGKQEVPYERLEPIAVTKENMDEVITGKYHEESDIYLNVRRYGQ